MTAESPSPAIISGPYQGPDPNREIERLVSAGRAGTLTTPDMIMMAEYLNSYHRENLRLERIIHHRVKHFEAAVRLFKSPRGAS